MRHGWLWIAVVLLTASTLWAADQRVYVARVQGTIGPATAAYLQRAIAEAGDNQAQCLIVELDTPGGLLQSTKEIVQSFLASPVPVVIYVYPSGATATSAGCFITMASDVAAMAPATSIGAAHPVELGGAGGTVTPDPEMKKKIENYAASYIESIAARHGRNAQWAVSAVRESASITAEKAKQEHVVEILASDMPDLLRQLDGRKVRDRELATASTQTIPVEMTLRERMFQRVWGPEVMFILMLVAIYGLIGELSNPGAILPGVAGGIALILMLYMASIVPVNIAGVALMILSLVLFMIDAFAPSHGVLTIGGAIAFLLGGLMMFDRTDPLLRISLWLLIPSTILTIGFFLFVVGAGLRAQFLSTKTGKEAMIGEMALAISAIGPQGGRVAVEGEYWNAVSEHLIPVGHRVRISAVHGLQLTVAEAKDNALEEKEHESRRTGRSAGPDSGSLLRGRDSAAADDSHPAGV